MPDEKTSPELATLAGKVLNGYEPTAEEIKSLAACVLTQAEDTSDISLTSGKDQYVGMERKEIIPDTPTSD